MIQVLPHGNTGRLTQMIRDTVLLAQLVHDGLNLSQVPMVDTGEQVMLDLQVQTTSEEEPEQALGSKRVRCHHLMHVPILTVLTHGLRRNMIQLRRQSKRVTNDVVWYNGPHNSFEPCQVWIEEGPNIDGKERHCTHRLMNVPASLTNRHHVHNLVIRSAQEEEKVNEKCQTHHHIGPNEPNIVSLPLVPPVPMSFLVIFPQIGTVVHIGVATMDIGINMVTNHMLVVPCEGGDDPGEHVRPKAVDTPIVANGEMRGVMEDIHRGYPQ